MHYLKLLDILTYGFNIKKSLENYPQDKTNISKKKENILSSKKSESYNEIYRKQLKIYDSSR